MSQTESQTQTPGPDVKHLAEQNLPETAFPGGRNQSFRVFFRPEAHEGLWKHALENITVEICGVLVGKWARDADGPFVLVEEYIRGEAAANKFAEVTFTHETWAKINEQMDTRFQNLSIVGWYHSHPDFGVFLSDRDRFIQEHFFSGPGQVALVVDPVRKTEGVFTWQQGKPLLTPTFWVGDTVRGSTAAGAETATAETTPAAGGTPGQRAAPTETLVPSPILLGLVGLMLFLLGFLVSKTFFVPSYEQAEQVATLRVLNAMFGLGQELRRVSNELEVATKEATALSESHLAAKEKPGAETKKEWEKVLQRLKVSREHLQKVNGAYALTLDDLLERIKEAARQQVVPEAGGKGEKPPEKKEEPKKKVDRAKKDEPMGKAPPEKKDSK
jgi:proteasome lid subunit RPN8/RPN11